MYCATSFMQHANTIGYELQTARKTVIDNVLGLACKYLYTLCANPPFKNITISRHCQSKSRCKHVVCSFPSIANMDKKQLKIILSISPSSLLLGWVFSSFQKSHILGSENFQNSVAVVVVLVAAVLAAVRATPKATIHHYSLKRFPPCSYGQTCSNIARLWVFLGFIGRYEYNIAIG